MLSLSLNGVSLPISIATACADDGRTATDTHVNRAFSLHSAGDSRAVTNPQPATRTLDPGINDLRRYTPLGLSREVDAHPASDLIGRPSLPEPIVRIQPQVQITRLLRPVTAATATLGQPLRTIRLVRGVWQTVSAGIDFTSESRCSSLLVGGTIEVVPLQCWSGIANIAVFGPLICRTEIEIAVFQDCGEVQRLHSKYVSYPPLRFSTSKPLC